jgi:hypothetical protein
LSIAVAIEGGVPLAQQLMGTGAKLGVRILLRIAAAQD